jgi:hypothetical protein
MHFKERKYACSVETISPTMYLNWRLAKWSLQCDADAEIAASAFSKLARFAVSDGGKHLAEWHATHEKTQYNWFL